MAEPSYYMECSRKREHSTDNIQINDKTVQIKIAMSPHEIEWSNSLWSNSLSSTSFKLIRTWKDYASHNSHISDHIGRLVIFENEKISCETKCIHNDFNGIQNCIRNVFLALSGSIMMYKKFENARLCYDCLMCLCSDRQNMERLFNEYHAVLTQWDTKSDTCYRVPIARELHYLSAILFKYQSFTMFVLNHDSLCDKIFSLFIFYMKNFKRLRHDIKDKSVLFHPTDQGYLLRQRGIVVSCLFEYTFNAILSSMRRLMCYFKTKHLQKLIQMNYFKHFIAFTDALFDLEYMRIVTDSMIPGQPMTFRGTVTLFQLFSVVRYINFRVINKLSLPKQNIKQRNKIFKIKKTLKAFDNTVNKFNDGNYVMPNLWRIFRDGRYLRDEYKCYFLMSSLTSLDIWSVRAILKRKSNQRRKLKRCGNSSCAQDINTASVGQTFKLCGRCRIVFYCSKNCQKRHWLNHRVHCKAFK
eukprot:772953_1